MTSYDPRGKPTGENAPHRAPEGTDGPGDPDAPRTLDEQQTADAPGEESRRIPGGGGENRPGDRGSADQAQHPDDVPPVVFAGSAGPDENTTQSPGKPDGAMRQDLPPENLVIPGELVLAAITATAVFCLLYWALGGLAGMVYLPHVLLDHRLPISLLASSAAGTLLWSISRAKRIAKARHLRGELPT